MRYFLKVVLKLYVKVELFLGNEIFFDCIVFYLVFNVYEIYFRYDFEMKWYLFKCNNYLLYVSICIK